MPAPAALRPYDDRLAEQSAMPAPGMMSAPIEWLPLILLGAASWAVLIGGVLLVLRWVR